jgi:hypothetical protein
MTETLRIRSKRRLKSVAVREGSSGVLTGRRCLLPLLQVVEAPAPLTHSVSIPFGRPDRSLWLARSRFLKTSQ